ncbi:hypothetical protein CBW24_06565 [Pacificitalea manganoxidans]|uniref:DUF5337 domain-containing protein n=1 Tax=Pacificitalea manganoxidans TaxID=1411902 RepID=A0A291LY93_9RHOB|nr:DUF5337 domain-containing protein [Pacificitalea manganoxidans]ATI41693.1 hypothetical protein CBW24_06565 [Pacificitalea manganoxidans]MAQ44309.1 hypothetical protein [Actibacterium sp.]MDR6309143.1 hypothetical protein [Pacificitalea manganoxidans]OWU71129.1 hypothetical protein ATO2_02125 [Roseovarius sp. 22II1-1F6A]|tara:strand:- start:240 stop:473 length:234 start_codon:yes stop_codon:yes gene_type:complete
MTGSRLSPDERRAETARRGRLVAIVIAVTGLLWIGANALGVSLGWSHSTMAFFDLAALAGFLWAMIVTYQIWRKSRQ